MKTSKFVITIGACVLLLLAGAPAWGAKGGKPGKPPPSDEEPPTAIIDDFYFWRWGHMDGPHDSSKALGISRDGLTAVGSTVVVDFQRAWRSDIGWAINTDLDGDTIPPLYNELQVQEDIGKIAPSRPSAAFAASDMTGATIDDGCPGYDKTDLTALSLDWCDSFPVGTFDKGEVTYGIEWLLPALDADEGYEFVNMLDYVAFSDFGGGISDMQVNDVSVDGVILVGTGNVKKGLRAFRVDTVEGPFEDVEGVLVPIPIQLTIQEVIDDVEGQTLQYSSAQAVSADGMIIAGYGGTRNGNKAFVTIFEGTEVDAEGNVVAILTSTILPTIPGGRFAEAYAMTVVDEVIYIAGRSDSPRGPQACIWFEGDDPTTTDVVETWVVKGLGGLSKKKLDSVATGIAYRDGAADGDLMVVGTSQSILYPSEAFVWAGNPEILEEDVPEEDVIGYMFDLEYILTKTGAGAASSFGSRWILNEATGVSALGDRIVGWGTNPEGGIEAWVVTGYPLDELSTILTYEE